jgi:hypothetical protein
MPVSYKQTPILVALAIAALQSRAGRVSDMQVGSMAEKIAGFRPAMPKSFNHDQPMSVVFK